LKDSFQYNINNNDVDFPNQVKNDMTYRYHTDYNNNKKNVLFIFFFAVISLLISLKSVHHFFAVLLYYSSFVCTLNQ